jgi:hypothetical protein
MHDRNGTPLKVGDYVMLPATIVEVQAHADFCNARVELLPMRGAGRGGESVVNTGQLILIKRDKVDD